MGPKKGISKTKEKMSEVFNQAKASLKILETLEKETLSKAKDFVKIPANRAQLTNEKILASLKKMGVATVEDVEALRARLETLEAQVSQLNSRLMSSESARAQNIPQG